MADRPTRDDPPPGRAPRGPQRARLERLTDGTLDDRDLSELEAAARTDDAVADQVDAYTPLDGLHLDRITEDGLRRAGPARASGAGRAIAIGAMLGLAIAAAVWVAGRAPGFAEASLRVDARGALDPAAELVVEVAGPPEARAELWAGAGDVWRRAGIALLPDGAGRWRARGPAGRVTGGVFGKVTVRAVLRAPGDPASDRPEATPPGRALQETVRVRAPPLRVAHDAGALWVTPEPIPEAGVTPRAFAIAGRTATALPVRGDPPWRLLPPAGATKVVVWLGPAGAAVPADPARPGLFSVAVVPLAVSPP